MLYGWDASDFDWNRGARPSHLAKAKQEGIRFFTHKITEGTSTVHRHAGEMLKAAKAAGIPFLGVYIVPRTPGNNGNGSIAEQVSFAIAETTRQFPEWKSHPGFFWQVDLEHWEYDKVKPEHGVEMARRLREKTGVGVVLYAPRWSYGDSVPGSDPLWASNYTGSGLAGPFKTQWARTSQMSHQGWGKYSGRVPRILQYSSDATIGGQHTCDANVFNGDEAAFRSMIGAPPATTPKPAPTPTGRRVVKVPVGRGSSEKPGVLNVWDTVRTGSVGDLILELVTYYPKVGEIYATSANDGDHGPRPNGSHHYGLSYNGSPTAAVDFGAYDKVGVAKGQERMRDFSKWLEDKVPGYRNIVELIHTTPYSTDNGYYVRNGAKLGSSGYGSSTNAAHANHVHLAMSKAQVSAALKKLREAAPAAPAPAPTPAKENDDMELSDRLPTRQGKDGITYTKDDMSVQTALNGGLHYALLASRNSAAVNAKVEALEAKAEALEAKVTEQDAKLDEILKLLKGQ